MSKIFTIKARLAASGFKQVKDFGIENMLTFKVDPEQDEGVIKDILEHGYAMTPEKINDLWDHPCIDKYHSNVDVITGNITFDGVPIANCSHLGSFIYSRKIKDGEPKRDFSFYIYKHPHESDAAFMEAHLCHKEAFEEEQPLAKAFPGVNAKKKIVEKFVFSELKIIYGK